MAAKKKKDSKIRDVTHIPPPDPCGVCRDKNGLLIGTYVYLSEGDEEKLERLCESWLETYKRNNNFFATIDLECLAPDTLVTLEDGDIVELKNIRSGTKILGCSSATPNKAPNAHLVNTYELINKGSKQSRTISPTYGLPITASNNHAFLTQDGWKKCKDLTTDDYLFSSIKEQDHPECSDFSDSELALIGWFIAEGVKYTDQGESKASVVVSVVEPEYKEWVAANANPYSDTYWSHTDNNTSVLSYSKKGRAPGEAYYKNPAKELLNSLGLMGKGAYEKTIPSEILRLSNRQLAIVLRCMFSGDGSVTDDRAGVTYVTTSKRLAEQLSIVLSRFGILSSLHYRSDDRKESYKDTYHIQILGEDAVLFYERIGFLGRKQEELRASLDTFNTYVEKQRLPKHTHTFVKKLLQSRGITPSQGIGKEAHLQSFWYRGSTISRLATEKILDHVYIPELADLCNLYFSSDFVLTPIRKIEDAGYVEVYDISVDTKQFIANSSIVHNTQGLDYINLQLLLFSISWDGRHSVVFSPYRLWNTVNSVGSGRSFDLLMEVFRTIPVCNQNVKFDAEWILSKYGIEWKVRFDTMVGAQVGWAGGFPNNQFGLDNIVEQVLKPIEISKENQTSFIGQPVEQQFTNEQIMYAANDSMTTHRCFAPIRARIHNYGLETVWEEMELPLILALVPAEFHGIKVDKELLLKTYDEKLKELQEKNKVIQGIYQSIPENKRPVLPNNEFNPLSWQQIEKVLTAMGIKVKNTSKDTLMDAYGITKADIIKEILEFKKLQDAWLKFIKAWLEEHINPTTGCIHPSFKTNHAETGRVACSAPNMMNVPPKLRSAIIARENHKLITCDFSSFEFRAAAAYTEEPYLLDTFLDRAALIPDMKELGILKGINDPDHLVKVSADPEKSIALNLTVGERELIKRFLSTDIHIRNTALVLKKSFEEAVEFRPLGKMMGYALLYSGGAAMVLRRLIQAGFYQFSLSDCEDLITFFYQQLPRVKAFNDHTAELVTKQGYISTFLGRKRFFVLPPRYTGNYYIKKRDDAIRAAVNAVYQSTNVDATKLSIVGFREASNERWSEDVPMVLLNVHDELVVEAHNDIAEETGLLLQSCMIEAGKRAVLDKTIIEAACVISDRWSK